MRAADALGLHRAHRRSGAGAAGRRQGSGGGVSGHQGADRGGEGDRVRLRASGVRVPGRERGVREPLARRAKLAFIGPRPETLALFGDKTKARELAQLARRPDRAGQRRARWPTPKAAAKVAEALGYPVMLKAAAGGGGRGMRAVEDAEEIGAAFARCAERGARRRSATARVFVEKLIARPRHIEVQVLADAHGDIIHLYERDCSIQLRNQKVVEIAPAPDLKPALRQRILDDAIRLAQRGRLRERRHRRVPGQPGARRALFHRVQSAHPGRAHGHRGRSPASTWSRRSSASPPARP